MNGLVDSSGSERESSKGKSILRNGKSEKKGKKSIANLDSMGEIDDRAVASTSGILSRRVKDSVILKPAPPIRSPKADFRRFETIFFFFAFSF